MNTQLFRSLGLIALSLMFVVGFSGCAKSNGAVNSGLGETSSTATTHEHSDAIEELPEFDANWLFESAQGLAPIYFDFDSYDLRPSALETLRENADKIKQVPGAIVQIEGHCDERGTQEYNLALGEKRALATRAHLINLGVSGDRIITISYGEEDPADPSHSEAAWSQNRRCEFNRAL